MSWAEWIRDGREIEPSLYAADFWRLGEQIDALLAAGLPRLPLRRRRRALRPARDDGPGRAAIDRAPDPRGRGRARLSPDGGRSGAPFEEFAASGADSVTFHVEATTTPPASGPRRARTASRSGSLQPGTEPAAAAAFAAAAGAEMILCMSIEPGYSGQPFMPEALGRIAELGPLVECRSRSTAASARRTRTRYARRARASRRRERRLRRPRPRRRRTSASARPPREPRARAGARGAPPGVPTRTPPSARCSSPDGASSARASPRRRWAHGEVVALAAAGERRAARRCT